MTTGTYSQNWDGLSSGTLVSTIPGWANELGSTLQVTNTYSNSGSNSVYASSSGDSAVYNGLGQLTDTVITAVVQGSHARLHARSDGSANWYELLYYGASGGGPPFLNIRRRTAGTDGSNFTLTGASATTPSSDRVWYNVKFSVTGTNPVTLQAKLWPIGGSEPAGYEISCTDSSSPLASGYPGIRVDNTASGGYVDDFSVTGTLLSGSSLAANGVGFSGTSASGTTVTTTAASGGTAPYAYQFQRAPSASGVAGTYANIGTAGTSLSDTDSGLSASTQYFYRVVVTDSASNTATGAASSVTTSAGYTPVAAGMASLSVIGNGTASLSATAASGGSGTLTYQWYRSTVPNAQGTAISGATTMTLSDTGLTNGVAYYYTLVATDGTTSAIYNQVAVIPARTLYVGLIGDSWNTTAAPSGSSGVVSTAAAGNILQAKLQALFTDGTKIVVNNQGVGGTNGHDWTTGGDLATALANLLTAHNVAGDWLIVCHLGINDSSVTYSNPSGGESASQYQSYMQSITTAALAWGARGIVFHGPPYIGPINVNHTSNGVALLAQYFGALQALAATNPSQIFTGVNEFPYFVDNQGDLGGDQVHPTPADANGQGGATNVATMWASCLHSILTGSPGRWTH
jgi:hypothetical protein